MTPDNILAQVLQFFRNTFVQTLLCIVVLKFVIDKLRRDPRLDKFAETLPGPPALPIIGNDVDFYRAGRGQLRTLFMKYMTEYGPIFRVWVGKHLLVSVSDLASIETILTSTKTLSKPPLAKPVRDCIGPVIFTSQTPVWKKNRKLFQPFFTQKSIESIFPEINSSIREHLQQIKAQADGPEFDIFPYLAKLTADTFIKIYLNLDMQPKDEKYDYFQFHRISRYITVYVEDKVFTPWLRAPIIGDLYYRKSFGEMKKKLNTYYDIISKNKFPWKQETKNNSDRDLESRSHHLTLNNKPETHHPNADPNNFSVAEFSKSFLSTFCQKGIQIDELGSMTVGGSEATPMAATNFLLSIAVYSEIQNRLYDELQAILGADNQPPTLADIQRLTYLDKVLKETQRMFPFLFSIFRGADEDVKIGALTFPRGTAFLVNIGAVHFDPNLYPEPHKFNPENFSPEAISKRSKFSYMPFSAGPRNCIGKGFALILLKLTLIYLLRNFTFHTNHNFEEFLSLSKKHESYKLSMKRRNHQPIVK